MILTRGRDRTWHRLQPRYFFDFDWQDRGLALHHGLRLLRILAGSLIRSFVAPTFWLR